VLVADYADPYNKQYVTFLLYKHGGYKELTKRREGKVLLERATAMLERTKLPNGYYLIDRQEQSRIWDSDIYKVISQMETAMYNLSLQFALPGDQEHPVPVAEASEEAQPSEEEPTE
jgi:hypothetical protein